MARRRLTLKQIRFAKAYAEHGNGTRAAREAGYSGSDGVLAVTAHGNLRKPKIQEAIQAFSKTLQELADETITEILKTSKSEAMRLKAAELALKRTGGFAPEKHEHTVAPPPLLPPTELERLKRIHARVVDAEEPEAPDVAQEERSAVVECEETSDG